MTKPPLSRQAEANRWVLRNRAVFQGSVWDLFPQIVFTLWGSYFTIRVKAEIRARIAGPVRKKLLSVRQSRTKWRFALARASRCGAVHIILGWQGPQFWEVCAMNF